MNSSNSNLLFVVIAFAVWLLPEVTYGQEDWTEKLQGRDSHFMFQTSLGLGVGGFQKSERALLMDENGFVYDTANILGPKECSELGLNKQQISELGEIRANALAEMKDHPSSKLFVEDQSELEAIFVKAQEDIHGILNYRQLGELEGIRHRKGIAQVGIAKYFSSSHFGKGDQLSPEDRLALESFERDYKEAKKGNWQALQKEGNQWLLRALTSEQTRRLNHTFGDEFEDLFVRRPMFVKYADYLKYSSRQDRNPLRHLKKTKIQTQLGLSSKQIDRVKKSLRDMNGSIDSILTEKQLRDFNRILFRKDLLRAGTVESICNRQGAEVLSLSEQESKSLHKRGKEIFVQLCEKAKKMDRHSFAQLSQRLSPELEALLRDSLGNADSTRVAERLKR